MELKNIESNAVFDLFREREHAIGCALTCAVIEKALVYRQILFNVKDSIGIRVQENYSGEKKVFFLKRCCLLLKRVFYLPISEAMLYNNRASAIVSK